MRSFAYKAQTLGGEPISGTIDAYTLESATAKLDQLGLRVMHIEPVDAPPSRPLHDAEFAVFNEHLARLAQAGLPIEQGMKLVAGDLPPGRFRQIMSSIADDLQAGTPLDEVIRRHQQSFPPQYAEVIEAGLKSGQLPNILLTLSKHLELHRQMRSQLSRATAYPLMVFLSMGVLLLFLNRYVFPPLITSFMKINPGARMSPDTDPFDLTIPWPTYVVWKLSAPFGWLLIIFPLLLLIAPMIWRMLRHTAVGRWMADEGASSLPVVGLVLRQSSIARWLDAIALAISTGFDLPRAVQIGNVASGSDRLAEDGQQMMKELSAGKKLGDIEGLGVLPSSMAPTLELAMESGALPQTLRALSDSHRRQAQARIDSIPTMVLPVLLVLIALIIGSVMIALIAPLARFIQWLTL